MSLWKIVLKNIRQRRLSSTLTAASIAIGVAIVIAVLALRAQTQEGFRQSAFGYELVVGPKRLGALQLVLNTVYHMETSPGNIPWSRYRELEAHKAVAAAVPISVGDSFRGARIVGTTPQFFTAFNYAVDGACFRFDPDRLEQAMAGKEAEGAFEAVAGARSGLRIGDTFRPSHGVDATGDAHAEKWTVVGVMAPTGTPNDRAIFINLDSFYEIRDHRQSSGISAVIVKTKGGSSADRLQYDLNQLPDVMAASPAAVMAEFFGKFDWIPLLFLAIASLVVVMAGVSIFVAIYNSMSERRRPIAILRALGARRSSVLAIILMESLALCAAGAVGGLLLGHLLTAVAGAALSARSGIPMSAVALAPEEFAVLGGVLLLGALAGLLPALQAYRTDIADGLSPSS
ncbi:MAG TPA: ABC transporter permease [Planctomycetota bacterium]|nr:ABC transporter permease [Planctomycetota bacterium]